jgi:hypothetical protein
VEPRIVTVGQSTAVVEASDDLLLDLTEERDELRDAGQIVRPRRTGQHRGALGRKRIRLRRRVVIDDPIRDHAAEPLAHVAFVQLSSAGDLRAGGRRQFGERVKQLGLVTN